MNGTVEAEMSDLVYAYLVCKRPLVDIARHAGTTTTKLLEELKRNPPPPHLLPSGT